MTFLMVNGVKTFYMEFGSGNPIIFIHGATANHEVWNRQIKFFAKKFKVITLDLPGHGKSENIRKKVLIEDYSNHVARFVSGLRLDKFFVVGHSMGGAIAMDFTLKNMKHVKGLVLVSTGVKLKIPSSFMLSLRKNFEKTILTDLKSMIFSEKTDKKLAEKVVQESLKCPLKTCLNDFTACNNFDFSNMISRIRIPTLIVVGKDDILTSIKYSFFLHEKIKNSKLEIIDDAGHMVMIEKPEQFNKIVFSFLSKIC